VLTYLFSTVNYLSGDNFSENFEVSELYNIVTTQFGNRSIDSRIIEHNKVKLNINYSELTIC